jgi:hypothetical protein
MGIMMCHENLKICQEIWRYARKFGDVRKRGDMSGNMEICQEIFTHA